MILYSYFRSSAAYRVRIALHFKAIDFQLNATNLLENEQQSTEYLAINPQGLIPAIKLDNGEVISQSSAIIEWLEECYPEPALFPDIAQDRAKVRALRASIACDIHPLNNLRVLHYLKNDLNLNDQQKNHWYQHWITLGFSALEQTISGSYSFADSISMADLYLIPQVYNALRFKVDISPFPNILTVYNNCNKHQAFIDAHPDNQPDNPSSTATKE